MYIYIYIIIYNLVGPGNSLDVSETFPSFTFPSRFLRVSAAFQSAFPLRFRHASGAFPSTFPLRFRWASACQTEVTQKLAQHIFVFLATGGRANPEQSPFWQSGSDLVSQPALSASDPPADVFGNELADVLETENGRERQMPREPKGRTNPRALQPFRRINSRALKRSHHVSATFPPTLPQRLRQRFRRVSVNVSVAFPLGRCVPDGNYPETLPAFPGPTKCVYIYIYIYIHIHIHPHI